MENRWTKRVTLITIIILVLVLGLFFSNTFIKSSEEINKSTPQFDEKVFNLNIQPVMGELNAPIKVVEFADFNCSHCADFKKTDFQIIKNKYIDSGKVAFYFLNYPVMGEDSELAAKVSEEIFGKYGNKAFWIYYNVVLENYDQEKTFDLLSLINIAKENIPDFNQNELIKLLYNNNCTDSLNLDKEIGKSVGVNGVPKFFVNGEMVQQWPQLISILENKLKGENHD